MKQIAIIGAGGFAREVLDIFEACNEIKPEYEVLGYIVQAKYGKPGKIINDKPILGDFDWFENHPEVFTVCAVGAPEHRRRLVEIAKTLGVRFCSILHPSVIKSRWVTVGEGSVIAAGCILTNQIQIGNHVHINLDGTIGHDAVFRDFVTLSPGVHVSGNVTLGEGCYLGTGANLIEKLSIGEWSTVGAGSTIVKNVPENTTVVGVPGKVIKTREAGWQRGTGINSVMPPQVSILMLTYNQEKYIAQAIESVLMQTTHFAWELVIGEDCSTDRTREICQTYQQEHPAQIRLLERETNLGMMENFVQTMNACRGQYVALLEGDDYWTSAEKLQKQVDFLDQHPEFSLCTHDVQVLEMSTGTLMDYPRQHGQQEVLELTDILVNGSAGATCSIVYRNRVFGDYPEAFKQIRGGDVPLQILCASKGKLKFLPEKMGVYRVHDRGAYYYLTRDAAQQNLPAEELLFQNMFSANHVIHQYFDNRYAHLLPRMNVYPNWLAAGYFYRTNSFASAYQHYFRAVSGLRPLPRWLPWSNFLRFSLALVVKSSLAVLKKPFSARTSRQ